MKSVRNDLLPIDTDFTFKVNDDASDGELGFSGTSSRLPAVASGHGSTPSVHPTVLSSTNIRARNEARKLLSHVLLQLANRRKPPAVLDSPIQIREESSSGALPPTLKETVKGIQLETVSQFQEDISDDVQQSFSTDGTINLVIQLEDVLATSIAQGWKIFDERFVANSHFLT